MNTDIDISKFRRLDGGLLVIFKELLDSRSVTQTARTLNLSQSTISQSLSRLRELFDDPLFVRRPYGMEPTQHALQLEPQISTLIEMTSSALGVGHVFDPARSNRIFSISAPEFVTATLITKLLGCLEKQAPNVGLTFVHDPPADVFDKLRRGDIACSVGRFEQTHPEIQQDILYQDEFCVAVRHAHPLSKGKLTEKKYQAARHIWANAPTETIERDSEYDYSRSRGSIVPRWLTALVVAAQSDYVATCPRRLAESQEDVLGLKLLKLPIQETIDVSLAYRKRLRDSGVGWLIEQIRSVTK